MPVCQMAIRRGEARDHMRRAGAVARRVRSRARWWPRLDRRTVLVLAGWAILLVAVRLLGLYVAATREGDLKLGAIPLYGTWDWALTWGLLAPVVAGAGLVAWLPWLCRSWSWRSVLAATAGAGVVFSLALALAETHGSVWLDIHNNYARYITFVDDAGVGPFLDGYTQRQLVTDQPVHLRSHPPGVLLFFWAAARVGLDGPWFENATAMVAVAVAIVAALAILRDVAGERRARDAAPFLVAAPAAVWHTNADVLFGGVALAGVACLILATSRTSGTGRSAMLYTLGGGLLAGIALLLSFGVVLLAIPVVVIAVWRHRQGFRAAWCVVAGGVVAITVVLLPAVWGYWWLDGFEATRERYHGGVASVRGYWYFVLANVAVFALALGPAIAVALARLRDLRVWLVAGSGLAVVAVADLSGMSSGETERIWQPFMPLVLLAGCALGRERPLADVRGWVAVQVVVTVALVAALRVPW
ncbi:hypothetical protein EF847_19345 [Actinobacteria bacterium YIM 96077]|uniref:Glycosyltransferase RgtA/B/C/D-like domain-containing protein n=1 Tax=Phytoactinopolyspora halophila TaxID=1981511 RepID=A0A329QP07_9ACTN|nr:hypothetical protein [Phytoactinopolyspora halophila]AYY14527.1 hypothetical protein EF847_19345 [Actinobacteria bacterium YIM 96077]RAW14095.1 hypothetical protein DPM12_11790 [Phytoactinopolyspora halophila]